MSTSALVDSAARALPRSLKLAGLPLASVVPLHETHSLSASLTLGFSAVLHVR